MRKEPISLPRSMITATLVFIEIGNSDLSIEWATWSIEFLGDNEAVAIN